LGARLAGCAPVMTLGRDDPLPLASLAATLMERAACQGKADAELAAILHDLEQALPLLQTDEPYFMGWGFDEAALGKVKAKPRGKA
jgi:hypothetical protein